MEGERGLSMKRVEVEGVSILRHLPHLLANDA